MRSDFLLEGKSYFVRGKFFALRRFRSFANLSAADRLFAASLRSDQTFADIFRGVATERTVEQLESICIKNSMASIALVRLACPEIAGALKDLPLFQQLLGRLRVRAAMEVASFAKFEDQLCQLTRLLTETEQDVVFIKGPAVGRLVYWQPHLRLSSDFDIVVRNENVAEFCDFLQRNEYAWISEEPGWCEQFGAGPTREPTDVLISPSSVLVSSDCLAFKKEGFPVVEVKVDPFERGIAIQNIERFWKDSQRVEVGETSYRVPSTVDCLLIALLHFHKDDFANWRLLYDVARLCSVLEGPSWTRFIEIANSEGVATSCFAGLALAKSWLSVEVPARVFQELSVKVLPTSMVLVEPQFRWNSNSLPVLLRSTIFGGGFRLKFAAIRDCVFPSARFITAYYGSVCSNRQLAQLLHWMTLALPAGATRRIFGKLWRNRTQQPMNRFDAVSNRTGG